MRRAVDSVRVRTGSQAAWAWGLSGVAYLVVGLLTVEAGMRVPGELLVVEPITLVAADQHDLACALETPVSGFSCEYAIRDGSEVRLDKHEATLVPYQTLHRRLYLIAGLFEDAAVHERARPAPAGASRDELRRFTAHCRLDVRGETRRVRVRWAPDGVWQERTGVPVAVTKGCTLRD